MRMISLEEFYHSRFIRILLTFLSTINQKNTESSEYLCGIWTGLDLEFRKQQWDY